MAGGHKHKPTSWVTVSIIIVGSVLLGFALPMESMALGVAGGVLFLVGLVLGLVFRIMDDAH
ncbi:MAG TPA: HGxxPAAW family protein [Mycobacteriales bacterium]|nr:HGxxPAAW family protein [Mycobacteriales bacterium]